MLPGLVGLCRQKTDPRRLQSRSLLTRLLPHHRPAPPFHLPWLGPSQALSLCAQALLPFGFMLIQQVGAPLCRPGIATSCRHLPGLMSQSPVMINDLWPRKVVLVCLLSKQDAVSWRLGSWISGPDFQGLNQSWCACGFDLGEVLPYPLPQFPLL